MWVAYVLFESTGGAVVITVEIMNGSTIAAVASWFSICVRGLTVITGVVGEFMGMTVAGEFGEFICLRLAALATSS